MHCSLIVNDFSVKPRKLNLVPVFKNVLHVSVITFAYVYQNTKKFRAVLNQLMLIVNTLTRVSLFLKIKKNTQRGN